MNHEPLIDVSDDITAYITNEDGFDVALLERVLEKSPAGEPRLTDDEWQSLVNLVNAAPAMLNALEAAHVALDAYSGGESSELAVIRKAIDKATK